MLLVPYQLKHLLSVFYYFLTEFKCLQCGLLHPANCMYRQCNLCFPNKTWRSPVPEIFSSELNGTPLSLELAVVCASVSVSQLICASATTATLLLNVAVAFQARPLWDYTRLDSLCMLSAYRVCVLWSSSSSCLKLVCFPIICLWFLCWMYTVAYTVLYALFSVDVLFFILQAEALVNTTDPNLGFGGFVAKALLKAAGGALKDECAIARHHYQ